ncbi:MAG: ATP synthase F1 subunit delta [Oscillospiraceae bacterium]
MTEVAKAYGGALYELSLEQGNSKDILEQISVLKSSFDENQKFSKLLVAPTLQKQERLAIVDDCFKGKIHPNIVNFIKILTENGTVAEFSNCVKEFRNRYNHDNNIEEATVVSAVALSADQTQRLIDKLSSITGKTILLTNKVDPSIIGGLHLDMEGVELEGSVKSKLDTLRQNLLSVTA